MSLLSKATRSAYLKELGFDYSKESIKKFQRIAFINPDEHDGKYGKKTDYALRHWHNVRKNCNPKNFKPEEFRCPCGHCTGYPVQMKAKELRHIQKIRDHYGKPMTITSALRCSYQNRKVGGVSDSRHLTGQAVDFYMPGVTDSFEHRLKAVKYIKSLPNHRYTYGNGINSLGAHVSKPSMGNALHTDTR